jgi:hypothetical protein
MPIPIHTCEEPLQFQCSGLLRGGSDGVFYGCQTARIHRVDVGVFLACGRLSHCGTVTHRRTHLYFTVVKYR